MSAYICDNETISQAADFLMYEYQFHHAQFNDFGDASRLAESLYAMNVDAVRQRYPDCDELPGPVDCPFVYVSDARVIPVGQSIKTLECLRYQCSEGDVTERPLYERLTSAVNSAKTALLARLCADYKDGSWGAYEFPADAPTIYSLSAIARGAK